MKNNGTSYYPDKEKQPIINPIHRELHPMYKIAEENQNKQLDAIEKGLIKFEAIAADNKKELENQNKDLDNLGNVIDEADDRVKTVTTRTTYEMKFTKLCADCGLLPCIGILAVLIIILIAILVLVQPSNSK